MDSKQFWASLRATVARNFASDPLGVTLVALAAVVTCIMMSGIGAALVVSAFKGTPK